MKGQHSPVQQRAPQSGPGRQSMRRGVRACGTGPQVCAAAMEEVSGSERPGLEGRPLPDTWGELGRGRQAGHLPLTVHTRPAYSQPACPPQAWLPLAQGDTRRDGKDSSPIAREAPASGLERGLSPPQPAQPS